MIIPKTQRRQLMISTAERTLLGGFVILLALVSSVYFVSSASAAGLTVTPITWNVIGLDSNNVNVGPNNFPVGARVCNTSGGTANNVVATFNWDTSNSFINLRSGSLNPINLGSLANNACRDAYFEVTVSRDANAYNQTRRYYISVAADPSLSGFTSKPREIFVEHLISQNRNSTNDVKLNGVSIPVGGSMSLLVGNS